VSIRIDLGVLQEAGLTHAEAVVYVALLELGSTSAGAVLSKTGLQNSVLHRALNSLIQKGLVAFVLKGKNREYCPESPKRILALLDQKKKGVEEILPLLEKNSAALNSKYSTEMYLGKRGVFSSYLGLVEESKPGGELLSFSLIESHEDEEIHDFHKKFYLVRVEKKLITKIMANKKAQSLWEKQYSRQQLRFLHARYTNFEFPQGIVIFQNKVLLVQFGENPSSVKITSNEMAENFRKFFYSFYNKEKEVY